MKKNIIFLMALLLGLSWYTTLDSWVGNHEKYEKAISQAKVNISQKLYLKAIDRYEEAMTYVGENVKDNLEIANLYKLMGDGEAYATKLHYLIERFGPQPEAVNGLYEYYRSSHSENKAIDLIKNLREKYPEDEVVTKIYQSLKGEYYEMYNTYPLIGEFYGTLAVYEADGKKGLIDADGEIYLPAVYDEITIPMHKNDMVSVREGSEIFYVNESGYRVAVPDGSYQYLGALSDECILAQINNKYGYLDQNLNVKADFVWDDASIIKDKIGAVKLGNKWALIDRKMNLITDYIYDDVKRDFLKSCFDQERIWVKQNGSYKMIDKEGNDITSGLYSDVGMFAGADLCPVRADGKWGYADATGKLVIPYRYDEAGSFSQGFAPVKQNGLWGYIDESGLMVIDEYFQQASGFNKEGTAPVKIGQEWVLIKLKTHS